MWVSRRFYSSVCTKSLLGGRIARDVVQSNIGLLLKTGSWVGRVKISNGEQRVVSLDKQGNLRDLTQNGRVLTVSHLLQHHDPVRIIREEINKAPIVSYYTQQHTQNVDLKTIFENSIQFIQNESFGKMDNKKDEVIRLISPHDMSSMKGAGVVFVKSLLERVVEEQAKGDPDRAHKIRKELSEMIGKQLHEVKPGSKEALELLRILTEEKALSRHYLEVGLGPDAELFTKAQPMSTLGFGAQIGINPKSVWNNPEPEIVVVANRYGSIVGCTLGNDVNLRDWEGRSALLLGRAKDVNGSCMLGPFIRLFDETFTLDDVRSETVKLTIYGEEDGYKKEDLSSMKEIGRDVQTDLVAQAFGAHQYPDGLFLMTGTMFAPVDDRDPINSPKLGFTHRRGDHVVISTPNLGTLYNVVNYSDKIPEWDFGMVQLFNQFLKNNHNN